MAGAGILNFLKTYRNIGRIRQVVNVFLKHGFGRVIEQLNLYRFIPLRKRFRSFGYWPDSEKHTIPQRLRMAFSELGPSFIKLAQLLSSRPDLITPSYADEFKKLQDKVPSFSAEEARGIIESELNMSLHDVFSDFDETPVAAASIAQVHNAVLKSGEKVIVKIQRPRIREIIDTDIAILSFIAKLMVKYIPESKMFNPTGIVEEFSRNVKKELDFVSEAKNAERFRKNFDEVRDICIPAVYPEMVSEKVIVMERLEGLRIDDISGIDALGLDRARLAKIGVDAYFKMIFEDGFFHADPHPGNIFVMPDGRLGIMDFGIVGWLTPDIMENMASALLAVIKRDFDLLVSQYVELGLISEEVDIDAFKRDFKSDLADVIQPLYDLKISEVKFEDYLEILTHLAVKHGLRIPSDLLLMNKTMLILDNIGRQLDPNFNFMSAAEPYAAGLAKRKMNPARLLERLKENLSDISDLVQSTPKQLNVFLRKTLKGEISFKVHPAGMERLIKDIDRSSNRLAFSVIVAAIIVGSSLLVQSGPAGMAFGLPIIGAAGFFIAFILGVWLLISILRSGRF
jgi:ubiquinone biosynthesis protein